MANTNLERLVTKASAKNAQMFTKRKVKRLSKEAAGVQGFLRSLNGTNPSLADSLAQVMGIAFSESITLRDPSIEPVPGAVVFATSKDHSGRHGYALRRPLMVTEAGENDTVRGIRFHSGNVGKKISLKDVRQATASEIKTFFRNNWDAKREKVLAILG